MNVVKKAKFVLFFDNFIRDLENQAKDFVSRLKNMTVHNYVLYIYGTLPVAKVLETPYPILA